AVSISNPIAGGSIVAACTKHQRRCEYEFASHSFCLRVFTIFDRRGFFRLLVPVRDGANFAALPDPVIPRLFGPTSRDAVRNFKSDSKFFFPGRLVLWKIRSASVQTFTGGRSAMYTAERVPFGFPGRSD